MDLSTFQKSCLKDLDKFRSFRTKKDRSLELTSADSEVADKKRVKIAVKVVDIFGNDTMTIVDLTVGGKTGAAK